MIVRAWQVHDTGLVAAPSRFRRLPGSVRHHQGAGPAWPAEVVLEVADDELRVADGTGQVVGRWPVADVAARQVAPGPPVHLVVDVPGGSYLLAAPADAGTAELLATLAR